MPIEWEFYYQKRSKMNKYIKISISSLVLVFFIIYNFEVENFSYEVFDNVGFNFLLIFFFIISLELFLSCIRWHIISVSHLKESFITSCKFYLSSIFISVFLTPAGGDAYRIYLYKDRLNLISKLVLFERIFSIIIIILTPLILFLNYDFQNGTFNQINDILIKTCAGILFLIILFICFIKFSNLSFLKNQNIFIKTIVDSCKLFFNFKTFFSVLFINITCVLIFYYAAFFMAKEINFNINFQDNSLLIYLSDKLRYIPVTFQGIGFKEISFTKLASLKNYKEDISFIFSLLFYSMDILIILFWSYLGYNFRLNIKSK